MLDRVLKAIITLTLLLFLLQALVGVLGRLMNAVLTGAVSTIGHVGSFLGSVLVAVLSVCFLSGLLIRLIRWLRESGVSGRPHRSGTTARQEWSGRESADEVPIHQEGRPTNPRRAKSNRRERD